MIDPPHPAFVDAFFDRLLERARPKWRNIPTPYGWNGSGLWLHREIPKKVIVTFAREKDGLFWVHMSFSTTDHLPTWEELKDAKDTFLGDVFAYQVFPPKDKFVNVHACCLHLWHCLEKSPVPDFTRHIPGLGNQI